jgi:hypothetical protein
LLQVVEEIGETADEEGHIGSILGRLALGGWR